MATLLRPHRALALNEGENMHRSIRLTLTTLLLFSCFVAFAPIPPALAASLVVTKTADTNDGTCDSDCSLREAIAASNIGDTISFASSLSGGTIYLASTLTINKSMTIDGSALTSQIIISGDSDNNGTGDVRVFFITLGATVMLDSLTIKKGTVSGLPGGGGIYNDTGSALTITNSTLSNNSNRSGPGGASGMMAP
jgi:CSLREA domain-containing protein